MPPFEPDGPWQSDPAGFARCPGCGTLRPVVDGLIAGHDRPDPWVPYDQASARCFGTGLPPAEVGDDMTAAEFDARLDAATPTNVTAGSPTVRYPPADSGGGDPIPRAGTLPPRSNSEATHPARAAAEETVTRRDT